LIIDNLILSLRSPSTTLRTASVSFVVYLRTASIGDFFGSRLIFEVKLCIIPNKMNTEYKKQETDDEWQKTEILK